MPRRILIDNSDYLEGHYDGYCDAIANKSTPHVFAKDRSALYREGYRDGRESYRDARKKALKF